MLKITLHGAAKEVGRSCVEISDTDSKGTNKRVLLDAGLKFNKKGTKYPEGISNIKDINLILISHAHLDHTGALPVFHSLGYRNPIFTTSITRALLKLLLKDNWKIEKLGHHKSLYNKEDIYEMTDSIQTLKFNQEKEFNSIKFRFFDAGHIPGSASILVQIDDKKVLYTGDIKSTETELMKKADIGDDIKNVDVLIVESTYGDRSHAERKEEEKRFLDKIEEVLAQGKSVLISTFAVGRAQEVIMILAKRNFGVPVHLDGMARDVTNLILEQPYFIKDADALSKAARKINFVKGHIQRKSICRKQGIFLTTSGMMDGGPIMDYLKYINNKETELLLTGYQVEGSNGSKVLKKEAININGKTTIVECNVTQFDFSAHSDLNDLKKMIITINPKNIVFNHGDSNAVETLLRWAETELTGIKVYAPDLNKTINIE